MGSRRCESPRKKHPALVSERMDYAAPEKGKGFDELDRPHGRIKRQLNRNAEIWRASREVRLKSPNLGRISHRISTGGCTRQRGCYRLSDSESSSPVRQMLTQC